MVRIGSFYPELSVNNTSNTSHLHQSSYSGPGHLNASFPEFLSDLGATVATLTFPVNLSDQTEHFLGFYPPYRGFPMKPIIITASAYFKRVTHPRGGRFPTANIVRYSLINLNICCLRGAVALGEDAHRAPGAAFFRMSRSTSASRSCFFNLATSACSGDKDGLPCPEKLPSLFCLYSRFHRLNKLARISNSRATSPVGLPDRHSSTAITLKARSKCLFSCFMSAKLRIISLNSVSTQR